MLDELLELEDFELAEVLLLDVLELEFVFDEFALFATDKLLEA